MHASLRSEQGQATPQVGNTCLYLPAQNGSTPSFNEQKRRTVWKTILGALTKISEKGSSFLVFPRRHQLIGPLEHRRNILPASAKHTLSSTTKHIEPPAFFK
jgi:hypothetical protein